MIDILDGNDARKLSRAVRFSYEEQAVERETRNSLIRVFGDESRTFYSAFFGDRPDNAQYLPLFQQFVRGHVLALGYQLPRWSVKARQESGRGFDKRMELLLNYYMSVMDGLKLIRQWSLDTAFGDCVSKVMNGPTPLGITGPLAPRVERLDPNRVIRDRSKANVEDSEFIGDLYLVNLKDAQSYPEFDPQRAQNLRPYLLESDDSRSTFANRSTEAYPSEVVRLLDIYIPSAGIVVTYDSPNDTFLEIGSTPPLRVHPTSINPYTFGRLVVYPDSTGELSRLYFLRQLNFLANDMIAKAARQARLSKRNPIDQIGNESTVQHVLDAPDNEGVFVNDKTQLDLYVLPGPEPSIVQLGNMAAQIFSQQAGNIETAMGISPGAPTARQTQSMLSQISAVSSFDRGIFEQFLSDTAKKIATLAFESETLELEFMETVPGTSYTFPVYWGPPHMLPRVGEITDYNFEVVPYSSAFRSPQERLEQLQTASMGVMQWMQAAAQGAPVNIQAIIQSYQEAFDLVDLREWWNGQEPSPVEKTTQTYASVMQHQPGGSQINYSSDSGAGQLSQLGGFGLTAANEALAGGLSGGV